MDERGLPRRAVRRWLVDEAAVDDVAQDNADRGTLAARVAERRAAGWRPGPADVLCVARPLAGAVAALHRVGVVHRDLSPGNVLLRSGTGDDTSCELLDDGEGLLLADLALCKDLAINSGLSAAAGTEGFRPPEQRRGPARVDARADLWALSALLTWLVTGRAPTPGSVVSAVVDAGLPRTLGKVLERSLAEHPEARHDDAGTWLADAERALAPPAGLGASAGDDAGGHVGSGPDPAGTGSPGVLRRGAVLALVAVVGVVVGGLLTLLGPLLADGPDVAAIDGGDVRVSRSAEGATVALTGPAEVPAGQAAAFAVDLDGVQERLWIGPDGVAHAGAARLELRTTSPGVATVRLLGVTAGGEPVEVAHQLRVTDA
jgi:hypothetical protein